MYTHEDPRHLSTSSTQQLASSTTTDLRHTISNFILSSYPSSTLPSSNSQSISHISGPGLEIVQIPNVFFNNSVPIPAIFQYSRSCFSPVPLPAFHSLSTNQLQDLIPSYAMITEEISVPSPPPEQPLHSTTTVLDVNLKQNKKYKPVALKVKPIIGELPDKFRIVRNIKGDPLAGLPVLDPNPPKFSPIGRYTQERKNLFDEANSGFLWPDERDLLHHFMMLHQDGFAWNDTERGISEKISSRQSTCQWSPIHPGFSVIFQYPPESTTRSVS